MYSHERDSVTTMCAAAGDDTCNDQRARCHHVRMKARSKKSESADRASTNACRDSGGHISVGRTGKQDVTNGGPLKDGNTPKYTYLPT
jgi:hypothetical protein